MCARLVLNTVKIGGTTAVGAFHDLLCFVHRATYIGASETCLVGSAAEGFGLEL